MTTGELWWNRITNPNRLVNDILDCLYLGRSVIVDFPVGLPWADVFKDTLENALSHHGDERTFDVHDASKVRSAGKFLYEKYCGPNEKNKIWASESYESFMAKNKNTVLNTKYVCIEGINTQNAAEWLASAEEYLGCFDEEDEHGIFVLLNNGTSSASQFVTRFSYTDYISEYDCLMLCLTIVSEMRRPAKEKQYIAEFASALSAGNYELAGCLAERGVHLIEDPYKTVQEVFMEKRVSYTELTKLVDSALWEAQTKLVFPIVEAYRKYFSEKYRNDLLVHLPFKDNVTGQLITSVNELEIGHLFFISEKYKFADKADFDRLFIIKAARNDSSHWNVIELKRFREIIVQ